ncbi:MAG: FAD-dependent oxidoreductase [Clostridia bacterium]|nr:FAD-dependent oxidoreductase [Clostridia bacterium]
MYDIIIIGGGPAGLTAALYALRAEKSVLVLEKSGLGGQIALSGKVENFPGVAQMSGSEFADNLSGQVEALGGQIEYETALEIKDGDVKTVVTDFGEYTAKSVIIATGVKNRRLGAAGEDELIGKGVSFCAVCDGTFYKGKTVAVIGGGNTAVEDAEYLADIAQKVYLIHRRDRFRAEERLVKRLEERENVEFILDSVVQEFCIDSQGLSGMEILNVKTGQVSSLKVDGAFVAVGQIPQNDIFKGLIQIDDGGYINAGENCLTNKKGIFVAGDCRNKTVRQLTTAVGDGSVAALAAVSFISEV